MFHLSTIHGVKPFWGNISSSSFDSMVSLKYLNLNISHNALARILWNTSLELRSLWRKFLSLCFAYNYAISDKQVNISKGEFYPQLFPI